MFLVQTMIQTMVPPQLLAPSVALAPSKIVAEKPVKLWVFSPYVQKIPLFQDMEQRDFALENGVVYGSSALTAFTSSLDALQRIR